MTKIKSPDKLIRYAYQDGGHYSAAGWLAHQLGMKVPEGRGVSLPRAKKFEQKLAKQLNVAPSCIDSMECEIDHCGTHDMRLDALRRWCKYFGIEMEDA